jgi:hypothetical protein
MASSRFSSTKGFELVASCPVMRPSAPHKSGLNRIVASPGLDQLRLD